MAAVTPARMWPACGPVPAQGCARVSSYLGHGWGIKGLCMIAPSKLRGRAGGGRCTRRRERKGEIERERERERLCALNINEAEFSGSQESEAKSSFTSIH